MHREASAACISRCGNREARSCSVQRETRRHTLKKHWGNRKKNEASRGKSHPIIYEPLARLHRNAQESTDSFCRTPSILHTVRPQSREIGICTPMWDDEKERGASTAPKKCNSLAPKPQRGSIRTDRNHGRMENKRRGEYDTHNRQCGIVIREEIAGS